MLTLRMTYYRPANQAYQPLQPTGAPLPPSGHDEPVGHLAERSQLHQTCQTFFFLHTMLLQGGIGNLEICGKSIQVELIQLKSQ